MYRLRNYLSCVSCVKPTGSKKQSNKSRNMEIHGVPQSQTSCRPRAETACSDITLPLASISPGSQFPLRQHPCQPVGFSAPDLQKPIQTNKWWGTLPIPGAEQGYIFSFPYTLWWSQDNPSGMNIQHVEASQKVFDTANSPPQYYLNPLGIISWNMGLKEFDSGMSMKLDTPTQFTINVTMSPGSGDGSVIMPLAQGMAYTTGIYSNLTDAGVSL